MNVFRVSKLQTMKSESIPNEQVRTTKMKSSTFDQYSKGNELSNDILCYFCILQI
jgi:hypothetical protein